MLLQMLRAPPITVSNAKDAARGSSIRMPLVIPGVTDGAALQRRQEAAAAREAAAAGWLKVWGRCYNPTHVATTLPMLLKTLPMVYVVIGMSV